MKLKYVGKHTAGVEVVVDGVTIPVEHGGTVEVSGDAAKDLIASGEYKKASGKSEEKD